MAKKKTKNSKQHTVSLSSTYRDMMVAVLIVSLTINMIVLIGWIALQVTTVFDAEVASMLFVR